MSEEEGWRGTATIEEALNHGLKEQEFTHLVELLGRDLNMVELGICSALYSEHCSYKSTKVHLKDLPTEGPQVIQGPGENAGIIDIGDGQAVAFKIESHNHPSYIEPYQGAATGVGGILRDVFTMGARPLACLNALRFGASDHPKTSHLVSGVVGGIGGYGNCVGIPTIGGEVFLHEAYNGNCLVNAFALGLVEHEKIFLGYASGVGNSIIYVGSKTGRDGIHGATMASDVFDENSEEKRPTVQVGDPFQEKLLLEACIEAMATGAVVGIQDMGAAGLTSSAFEMAERAGTGVRMHLDQVPQREVRMNPYEIMLSESQERMLLIVEKGREEEVLEVVRHWELDATTIGEVVEDPNVELYWHGEVVSSMPVALVTSSVPQYRWPESKPADYDQKINFNPLEISEPEDLSSVWLGLLGSLNLCSRKAVYRQYDSTVRSNTAVHPGGDAAVIRIKNNSGYSLGASSYEDIDMGDGPEKGVAMTLDCNSRYCSIDPRQGTALSFAEACRNIACVGAKPVGLSNCLNFGSPERPEGMWEIAEAIRGLGEAGRAFDVPVVSGNVSLYNESSGQSILPTPQIAMVGLMDDVDKCIGSHFRNEGDCVFVLGETRGEELGGSEYLAQFAGAEKGALPILDYDLEKNTADLVRALIDEELLASCHDISAGGLAIALAEACFGAGARLGVSVESTNYDGRKDGLLFSETGARYICSCTPDKAAQVKDLAEQFQIPITLTGTVGGKAIEIRDFASIDLQDAYDRWNSGLDTLFN